MAKPRPTGQSEGKGLSLGSVSTPGSQLCDAGVLGPPATFRKADFAVFFLKVYTVLPQMGSSRNSDPAKLVTMGRSKVWVALVAGRAVVPKPSAG